MFSPHNSFSKIIVLSYLVLTSFSCSKDSDLLSDYVLSDKNDLQSIALLVDDRFFISNGQPNIVLDVLKNDSFGENSQVTIVGTSSPQYGDVVINTDNTLTYTAQDSNGIATNSDSANTEGAPATNTPPEDPIQESDITAQDENTPIAEDSFTYITEVTTPDNNTLREEATVTITVNEMGELKAFPGAEGFGKYTIGGRGGNVIHVTNLNDSGPGSLRAALEKTGARTVVFDVGGDIYLNELQLNISSSHGNITIAGETAPFPGITIRGDNISNNSYGATLNISASDVIIRYISIRENNSNRTSNDAIRIRNDEGLNNVILDHVSMSHGSDENFSLQGTENVTVQNCMITRGDNSYNILVGERNYNLSFIGNYLSHTSQRNVLVGYGTNRETSEYINNIIYGYEEGMNVVWGNNADILGNIYKSFINNKPRNTAISLKPNEFNNPSGKITDGSLYFSDNFQLNPHDYDIYNSDAVNFKKTNRVINNSQISSWQKTRTGIENRVFGGKAPGNSLHQDSMDAEVISDYFNNSGSFNSPTVPKKSSTSRPTGYDTDNDGMADDWERSNFGSLNQGPNGDHDNDGYTNIELFFYFLTE